MAIPFKAEVTSAVSRNPAGKRESLQLALGIAGIDVCVGALAPTALGVLGFVAFLASVILLIVQLGSESRPYEWIAWFCLEASLVGIGLADLAILASRTLE